MTLDRTLKRHGALAGSRSVLTRAERIAQLTEEGKFDAEADSPLGLPKTRVKHSKAGSKTKKAAAEEVVETAEQGEENAEGKAVEQESDSKS